MVSIDKMKEKLRMIGIIDDYGFCGEKAPFKDSNGDNLYTGDVIVLIDKNKKDSNQGIHSIVKDTDKIFIMGIKGNCPNYEKYGWEIYKEKSYMSMKHEDRIGEITYKKVEDKKEMIISKIEKKLGNSIKIIKEK